MLSGPHRLSSRLLSPSDTCFLSYVSLPGPYLSCLFFLLHGGVPSGSVTRPLRTWWPASLSPPLWALPTDHTSSPRRPQPLLGAAPSCISFLRFLSLGGSQHFLSSGHFAVPQMSISPSRLNRSRLPCHPL
uniref:Uncharacterized protein n=1 Tax=Pipistrellus kuhlii TaxID=59472 RepID=A0A7J7Y9G3_PIPKU|nr:hypothetical protein mPipKuh1_010295 [Pipistrellus kuhlii]